MKVYPVTINEQGIIEVHVDFSIDAFDKWLGIKDNGENINEVTVS